jgi:hypothetical protein
MEACAMYFEDITFIQIIFQLSARLYGQEERATSLH